MPPINNRNYNIDILKLLCAFFVVIIHTSLWGGKEIFIPIARCAVPCFFMISGFFIYNPNKEKMKAGLKRSIKHILFILLWSNLFYIALEFVAQNKWELSDFTNLIIFNTPSYQFGIHLWYLFAYLYVLLTVYIFLHYNKLKWLKAITPVLLIILLIGGCYCQPLFHISFPLPYTRNFLFTGIPFFIIGTYIKEHSQEIKSIKNLALYNKCSFIIFSGIAILESIYLNPLTTDNTGGDVYIGSIFAGTSLFLAFLLTPSNKPNLLSTLGEKDSLYIYIFHLATTIPLFHIRKLLGGWSNIVHQYCGSIIVFLFTIVGIEVTRWLWNITKNIIYNRSKEMA